MTKDLTGFTYVVLILARLVHIHLMVTAQIKVVRSKYQNVVTEL